MKRYTFWNNKGGTGKTSLCFQCIVRYAELHPDEKILTIDLCPQANLSELLLGGLVGNGASRLASLYQNNPRKSIGGYFDNRIISPFTIPSINGSDYICQPHQYHSSVPDNIDLVSGDSLVEHQVQYMSAIANQIMPNGISAYAKVLNWINDLINIISDNYDVVFIDCNPSFSIYTQMAITASENLIIPVMADDSSRRALQNVLSLIYGYRVPQGYTSNSFNTIANQNSIVLPKIHLILKNRLTQYMGAASGYQSVLRSIDQEISQAKSATPQNFTQTSSVGEVRDFQTTGVVAFAEAKSFSTLLQERLTHLINGQNTTLNRQQIQMYVSNIDDIVNRL
jgi:ATPases involved in chromosome partitioning